MTVEPQSGTVLPGNTTFLSAKLAAAEVGAIIGELVVTVTGRPEPYRHSISATVVQQSYELTDTSNAAISEVGSHTLWQYRPACMTATQLLQLFVHRFYCYLSFCISTGNCFGSRSITCTQ